MVAPVQGTIGKSSQAPATQDYLNELTNFYNKKENEGVESEFVAPDGSKYKIQDASYLSTVRTNVNTGKFDAKAEENTNKEVSKDADTSIGSYAADKKAAAGKKDNASQSQDNKDAISKGEQAKSSGANVITKGEKTKASSTAEIESTKAQEAPLAARLAKSQDSTAKANEATKETFTKMEADNTKTAKESKVVIATATQKFHQAVTKRKAKIAKEKAKAEAKAAEAADGDSTQQSGSKMGFEGKLMTTAPASSGNGGGSNNAAQEKAWEDTMNGKIATQSKLIQTEEPKLVNVKAEGEKAAQPLLDQAAASTTSAGNQETSRHNAVVNGENQYLGEGLTIGAGTITFGLGVAQVVAGIAATPVGWGLIASGTASTLAGGTTVATGIMGAVANVATMRGQARGCEKQHDAFLTQASLQEGQSMTARRNAIVQAQAENVKILKATQALNKATQEMSQGLSSSSLSAINTDGMDKDQLETVKQDRYNQIMAHEQQHAAIIGGSPVIETDANGVAIGGYVQIDVPSLDESDLEGTIEKAQKVVDAALAPSDPSSQDQSIASQAKDVLSKAQDMLAEKTEKAKENEDKKPEEKKEEVKEEPKAEVKEDKNEAKKAA